MKRIGVSENDILFMLKPYFLNACLLCTITEKYRFSFMIYYDCHEKQNISNSAFEPPTIKRGNH